MAIDASARNLAAVLRKAYGLGIERLDAQQLLLHALGKTAADRAWLLAHEWDILSEAQVQQMTKAEQLFARRAAGEPLAYLLGQQAFFNLALQVDSRVLIPRADTEVLVHWALELLGTALQQLKRPTLLDLGTGSGAIALALKKKPRRSTGYRPGCQQRRTGRSAGQCAAPGPGRAMAAQRLVCRRA